MIFIPTNNINIVNVDDNTENIFWNYNEQIIIVIRHYKNDEFSSFVDIVNDCTEDSFQVLNCSELACGLKPQLRYNSIIKKYFCTCPSSMICTKNTDEEEINHFKNECNLKKFNEHNGFHKDPLKAICHWQIKISKSYIYKGEKMKQKYKKLQT